MKNISIFIFLVCAPIKSFAENPTNSAALFATRDELAHQSKVIEGAINAWKEQEKLAFSNLAGAKRLFKNKYGVNPETLQLEELRKDRKMMHVLEDVEVVTTQMKNLNNKLLINQEKLKKVESEILTNAPPSQGNLDLSDKQKITSTTQFTKSKVGLAGLGAALVGFGAYFASKKPDSNGQVQSSDFILKRAVQHSQTEITQPQIADAAN